MMEWAAAADEAKGAEEKAAEPEPEEEVRKGS